MVKELLLVPKFHRDNSVTGFGLPFDRRVVGCIHGVKVLELEYLIQRYSGGAWGENPQ